MQYFSNVRSLPNNRKILQDVKLCNIKKQPQNYKAALIQSYFKRSFYDKNVTYDSLILISQKLLLFKCLLIIFYIFIISFKRNSIDKQLKTTQIKLKLVLIINTICCLTTLTNLRQPVPNQ